MASGVPFLSIIIPCYNQGRYLSNAIDRILSQDFKDLEILVVDDGSTDGTSEIAGKLSGVRLIVQSNGGVSSARNAGLKNAAGEFVIFLDADDWFEPGFLGTLAMAAKNAPERNVFHGSCRLVDPEGRVIGEMAGRDLGDDPYHTLLLGNILPVHTVMVRRKVIEKAGGFDPTIRGGEDWEMWLRLANSGERFVHVPAAWVVYRKHPMSASTNHAMMLRDGLRVCEMQRGVHPGCSKCGWALFRSRRNLRYNTTVGILLPNLIHRVRIGDVSGAIRTFLKSAFSDPLILWYLLIEFPMVSLLSAAGRLISRT